MTIELGEFEGKPIRQTRIEIRDTGHGLSTALKIDPVVVHSGSKAFVVMEIVGEKHRFDPMDEGDAWCRVNLTKAETCTVVDEELVIELIEKQREKNIALEIQEAEEKEREKGVSRLDLEPPDPVEAHNRGDHKRKRKDCPECQAEVAEAQRIAAEQPPKPRKRRGRGNLESVE